MLPTPTTTHLSFNNIYEPAEDSYLLLDTLSSASETTFLHTRFSPSQSQTQQSQNPSQTSVSTPTPLIVEVGTGSGVVLSFLHSHPLTIFGREDILTAGTDVNPFACRGTRETIGVAEKEVNELHVQKNENEKERDEGKAGGQQASHGFYLTNVLGDLTTSFRSGQIDVLVFNPPYVPTPSIPTISTSPHHSSNSTTTTKATTTFEEDSAFLEMSYAGGKDGMEITDRLLDMIPSVLSKRGVAYVLLCKQNKPDEVGRRIVEGEGVWGIGVGGGGDEGGEGKGNGWRYETVGRSGMKAGWEKLVVVRIWRDVESSEV